MSKHFEIKVAIVDDKLTSRMKIEEQLKKLEASLENITFTMTFYESGVSFLASEKSYNLVLLDYEMPDKNGIQVAAELESRNVKPRVLFISGYDELDKPLQKATQLRVVYGFIFKSDSEKEFQYQVEKVLKAILNVHWIEFKYYLVDEVGSNVERKREKRIYHNKKIDARKISYIKSTAKDVVTIYTKDETFVTTERLKSLFERLPKGEFEYSERRIIINLGFVHSIGKKNVRLITENELSLTKMHRDIFQKSHKNYLLEGLGD